MASYFVYSPQELVARSPQKRYATRNYSWHREIVVVTKIEGVKEIQPKKCGLVVTLLYIYTSLLCTLHLLIFLFLVVVMHTRLAPWTFQVALVLWIWTTFLMYGFLPLRSLTCSLLLTVILLLGLLLKVPICICRKMQENGWKREVLLL